VEKQRCDGKTERIMTRVRTDGIEGEAGLTFRGKQGAARDERGIALVVALVMLALLGILGALALYTSTTELRIAGNYRLSQEAFFVADAAIEYAFTDPAIYTAINPGVTDTWPLPGAGDADDVPPEVTITDDPDFNRRDFVGPNGTNPADIQVEWETCGSLPVGSGASMEAAYGTETPNKGNYFLVNVVGSVRTQPQTRIAIEALHARLAVSCPE
jgi:type II secretory pathway pseudopilin PulG